MITFEHASDFGNALDADDFQRLKQLLGDDCASQIGDQLLTGPDAIAASYEQNMSEGRRKLNELVWGQSKVERIDDSSFFVHF